MRKRLWRFLAGNVFVFLVLFSFFSLKPMIVLAQKPVFLTLFYSETCPHCAKEEEFLTGLKKKYPNLEIRQYEVSQESVLFSQVSQRLGKSTAYVPFTVIGEETVVGYLDDNTTGAQIEEIVKEHSKSGCFDVVGEVLTKDSANSTASADLESCNTVPGNKAPIINIPLVGKIDTAVLSLPALTVLLAFLDGFNPCAMWVLLFLLTLLINLKDRKKLLLLGGAFIFVSGLVYFLFLAAWLNVFFFLEYVKWIRITIAMVAIGSGVWHLRTFWQNRTGCQSTDKKKRQAVFVKVQNIVNARSFWLALAGIIALAISVNLLELVCSAGLPAIYTQVLSLAKLPPLVYYLYLLLYIFIFTLDDLVVFIIAVKSWHTIGISSKFSRWSNFVGGVVILLIGLLLIFKPEWIMFA